MIPGGNYLHTATVVVTQRQSYYCVIDSNDQRENQQSWTENVSQFYDNAISRLKVAVAIIKLHPDLLDHHIHYERDTI